MKGRTEIARLEPGPAEGLESGPTGWPLAKWLIPSASILFLVVGYVAMHGHERLLGWEQGLRDPDEYVATAADFVGAVVTNLLDLPSHWAQLLAPSRLLLLGVSTALLVLSGSLVGVGHWVPARLRNAVAARRWWLAARRHPELGLTCSLLLLVILKAYVCDFPLAKVEGVLVSQIDSTPAAPRAAPDLQAERQDELRFGDRLTRLAVRRGVAGAIATRSLELYGAISCSRRYDNDEKDVPGVKCLKKPVAFAAEQAEFTTQIVSGSVVLLLACLLIRATTSTLRAGLAWLCVASSLSVPYAYGKLEMSTERDFALIALKTRLDQSDDGKTGDMKQIVGVMLTRDKDTTTIATLQPIDCGGHAQVVRFWRIANEEMLWAREIFRTDVIAWKLSQEFDECAHRSPWGNGGNQ